MNLCQVRGKHTVGGIVFYKHLFLVNKLVGHFSYKVSCTLNHSTKCTNIVNVDENDKGNARLNRAW